MDGVRGCSVSGLLLKAAGSTSCSLVQAVTTVFVGSMKLTIDDPVWSQPLSHEQSRAEQRHKGYVIFVCTVALQGYFMKDMP